MDSFLLRFINLGSDRLVRSSTFMLLVMGSVVFSLPRIREAWFLYVVIVYPVLMIAALELTKRVLLFLDRIRDQSQNLLMNPEDKQAINHWWEAISEREHFIWSFAVALILASISLIFNQNTSWSRYTDAMGILYVGFPIGELAHFLILIPAGISQLKKYQPKLNPINPANTVDLQILAETTFSMALLVGISLLILNVLVATVSYLFPHLTLGVLFVSLLAWSSIICIAVYPHFILWGLAQQTKRKTLQELEKRILDQYGNFSDKRENFEALEETIKLYEQVQANKSFPISNTGIFSIAVTLFLNILPVIQRYF